MNYKMSELTFDIFKCMVNSGIIEDIYSKDRGFKLNVSIEVVAKFEKEIEQLIFKRSHDLSLSLAKKGSDNDEKGGAL